MKIIKLSALLIAITALTSCLKSKNDVGGLLNDEGTILSFVSEKAYINTDAQNIQAGYDHTNANFNFSKRANEAVKFFTIKVSQPRTNKLTGPLVIKVTQAPLSSWDPLPANAINVTDITIPQSSDDLIVYPVFFTVNKTLLNPALDYGVRFTLSTANQGVISELDKSIDVVINYSDFSVNLNASDYEAQYDYTCSVVDPVNQFGINNKKFMYVREMAPNVLEYADSYVYALTGGLNPNLEVANLSTGARTGIFRPRFILDAAGNVTSVIQSTSSAPSTAVTAIALDPTGVNKFVYTSNNVRTLNVKYSFTLTTTINGVVTPRTVKVSENFAYNPNQVYF